MSEKDEKDYGPLWQLEQQIKHHDHLALSYGLDATKYMAKAEDARNMAARYREAFEKLK